MARFAAIAALVAAASGLAAADPLPLPTVIAAPTAWLPPAGAVIATADADIAHGFAPDGDVALGLGGIAALDLAVDHDVRACDGCGAAPPKSLVLAHAGFRLGAGEDAWVRGQPAVVVGVRATFAGEQGADAHDAYVVASRAIGGLRIHVGLDALDLRASSRAGAPRLGATLRPTAGLELTVAKYPRTSLLADLAWARRADDGAPTIEALESGGVRYDLVDPRPEKDHRGRGARAAIELAVQHRGGEDISDASVLVGISGAWPR